MYTFLVESVLRGYHEYKDSWPEGSNFASALARGWRYFKIVSFAPEFAPSVSTHAHVTFLSESQGFTKNGDKFGRVKYWRITVNSPKFPRHNFVLYGIC